MWFGLITLLVSTVSVLTSPTKVGIIGGQNASIADHPWLVSLQNLNNNEFLCAGVLISPLWVLTTGMCELNAIHYIRAGSDNYLSGGIVVDVAGKVLHSDIDLVNFDHNIGLLRLKAPVSGDNIQPVVLPDASDDVASGDALTVAAWGTINAKFYIPSDTLQQITLSAITTEDCAEIYNHIGISENMICGSDGGENKKLPCIADTGSAAIWNGKLIGIFSHNVDCLTSYYPSVFMKIPRYLDWINEITGL